MLIKFKINSVEKEIDIEPSVPLLWVIRDEFKLKGTKFGCGKGACGACTLIIDNIPIRSCSVPVQFAEGKNIITIEGLNENHPVKEAWKEEIVPQCGYCQPGFMMATTALLMNNQNPSEQDIDDNITNICRCATYYRMRKAIHKAALLSKK